MSQSTCKAVRFSASRSGWMVLNAQYKSKTWASPGESKSCAEGKWWHHSHQGSPCKWTVRGPENLPPVASGAAWPASQRSSLCEHWPEVTESTVASPLGRLGTGTMHGVFHSEGTLCMSRERLKRWQRIADVLESLLLRAGAGREGGECWREGALTACLGGAGGVWWSSWVKPVKELI